MPNDKMAKTNYLYKKKSGKKLESIRVHLTNISLEIRD